MKRWLAGVMMAGVCGLTMPVEAQQAVPQRLTLERVFASPDLAGSNPRALKLSPDGKYVTVLRNRADDRDRYDLWAMDTATGEWRMLVDSKKIGTGAELSEAEKMQRERARIGGTRGIVAYDWAPDGKAILVPLDGDLYLATLAGDVRRLTASEAGELNPEISPGGHFASYVRDQNLVVLNLATGAESKATSEGKGNVYFGEAEFVAQEEMGRRTGYWWSPDDKRIAVQRFDESPVGIVSRAAIGAEGTKVYDQRYPKAGTANVLVDLYVINPDGSGKVKVDLGAETDIYLARVDWTPDGKTLLVQRQNRAQTVLDMLAVDPATGKSRILFSEKSGERSWVNLSDAYRPLKDGSLIWWSERDGHGHLYRFKDGNWTQLTRGDWEVAELVGVDEVNGRVTFLGNKDGVLERHLYTVDLARPGVVTRISEPGFWHAAKGNESASRIIVTRSKGDQPAQVMLTDAAGKRLAWVNENKVAGDHPYALYLAAHRAKQFGTIKAADGTDLHWEMITPKLEPGRKYPVFFQHYGGPHSQQVSRQWGGALQQYIVDRGYIWFVLDNRGAANRGKAFEDHLFQAMGGVEVQDQLAGAAYLKTLDFVDPARITTYGWSYGGYMTLKMLQAAPGTFAAGVSGAPVSKWELYDTHYTERYMGDPRKVQGAYDKANTVADATKISDPLLLIHGMADDNVVLEHSTVMMSKLQGASVPFEVMLYPGQTHKVGGPGVSVHLWKTILDFLDRSTAKTEAPAK
ncbi:S9 family peptidase [Sphingomonas koreensis]|uniref:S9 family peptidase n=1 Tax=Sphingomonas koreensis TaxID=93064 RepID=UPI000836676D|nr:dipeptidyl-peptidase-4 [Sphingomonas koreensis]RSU60202.1 S9 family peptidase [Sphingomonas koreensis]RSU65037.1 S9 family peptidase [Sphingomonas koreensis]